MIIPLIIICLIALIAFGTIRAHVIHQSDLLSETIRDFVPYSATLKDGAISNTPGSIADDIDISFHVSLITQRQAQAFSRHYQDLYEQACAIERRMAMVHADLPERVADFITGYMGIPHSVATHNDRVRALLLTRHQDFFDHCLPYPLDIQQRQSIISEEENCLVVSSAGSGKTSSIMGKVKYLTQIKGIAPDRILLISYTRKAAAELTERMATPGLRGYTFHKLALDIIGQATDSKPSICEHTDNLIIDIFHRLSADKQWKRHAFEFVFDYQAYESQEERERREQLDQFTEQKSPRIKAPFPDMDGRIVEVRSKDEWQICFALSMLGVRYRYEEPYQHPLADGQHAQYRPDFSIYYNQDGYTHRIYLEHFGTDEHDMVPQWFAKDRHISYEEANRLYHDGIAWKKAAHRKFGTRLLTTTSAQLHHASAYDIIKRLLQEAGVPVQERDEEDMYDQLVPRNSPAEKSLIRLATTFIALIKSSGKSIGHVLAEAQAQHDRRSQQLITHILQPIYSHYCNRLAQSQQIDFTDAIRQATQICAASPQSGYDYIIVDEFQDISTDRYLFLKALRGATHRAQLYCVGDDWQSIYRFSGSDMALFSQFARFFGPTEICRIETTYRFGEPLVSLSSQFIQRNSIQIHKDIHPFNPNAKTELYFQGYQPHTQADMVAQAIANIPPDKSVFLLGRYSFDDYSLSHTFASIQEGSRYYYLIQGRKVEFLTIHKSKGLEADYVIILQCNKGTFGFPSLVNDDPVLSYVLTQGDQYPFGEERRLFYVAITRAKVKTLVMYDTQAPSVFIDEFLHPDKAPSNSAQPTPKNANKKWTRREDQRLIKLFDQGKSVKELSQIMGRSKTAILYRLGKYGR